MRLARCARRREDAIACRARLRVAWKRDWPVARAHPDQRVLPHHGEGAPPQTEARAQRSGARVEAFLQDLHDPRVALGVASVARVESSGHRRGHARRDDRGHRHGDGGSRQPRPGQPRHRQEPARGPDPRASRARGPEEQQLDHDRCGHRRARLAPRRSRRAHAERQCHGDRLGGLVAIAEGRAGGADDRDRDRQELHVLQEADRRDGRRGHRDGLEDTPPRITRCIDDARRTGQPEQRGPSRHRVDSVGRPERSVRRRTPRDRRGREDEPRTGGDPARPSSALRCHTVQGEGDPPERRHDLHHGELWNQEGGLKRREIQKEDQDRPAGGRERGESRGRFVHVPTGSRSERSARAPGAGWARRPWRRIPKRSSTRRR
jgi:hypothetical protein